MESSEVAIVMSFELDSSLLAVGSTWYLLSGWLRKPVAELLSRYSLDLVASTTDHS